MMIIERKGNTTIYKPDPPKKAEPVKSEKEHNTKEVKSNG